MLKVIIEGKSKRRPELKALEPERSDPCKITGANHTFSKASTGLTTCPDGTDASARL